MEDLMSKKLFTEEEQQLLRQNPYVYSVSKSSLSLTRELKELFLEAYHKGQTVRSILEDYGFVPDILGNRRIWGISSYIRSEYQEYGEFTEGHNTRGKRSSNPNLLNPVTDADEIRQLKHEVDYLKQEMEFLKKFLQSELQGSRCIAHERLFLCF